MKRRSHRSGFTLVELLVVVMIIGLISAMLFPAIQMIRESARRTQCLHQVRQIALGLMNYESTHGHLPAGITSSRARPYAFRTWLQEVLPFIEQFAVFDQATRDYRSSPSPFYGHRGMQTVIPAFSCPSDPDTSSLQWTHEGQLVALTNYLGVNGIDWESRDGVFFVNSKTTLADIGDGTSNTLMIGERPPSPDFWYGWWYAGFGQQGTGSGDMLLGVRERKAPPSFPGMATYLEDCPEGPYHFEAGQYGSQCDTLHFWSHHSGGAVFALADGSARLMAYTSDDIMPLLATRNGGETVQLD